MNREQTLHQLIELGLHGMAEGYEAIIKLPINKQPEGHMMLAQLAEKEYYNKKNKRQELYLKLSKLRYKSTLEDVTCSPKRNLSKETLTNLADCMYIKMGMNILISGSTGCGKSYLACALAYEACAKGIKTMYFNMNKLTEQILLSKVDGTYLKLLARLEKYPLLVLDDFGLQTINKELALAILQILEDRYNKKSTIIVSQLPVDKWAQVISDPTIGDAIVDRIIYNAHRIELKGTSMREKSKQNGPAEEPSLGRPTGSLDKALQQS